MSTHLTFERATAFFLLRKMQKIYVDAEKKLLKNNYCPAPGKRNGHEYVMGSAHDVIVELERALNLEHDDTYAAPDGWLRSLEEPEEKYARSESWPYVKRRGT